MTIADTAKSQVRYLEETVTWGVVQAAAMKNMRTTGQSLKYRIDTTRSNEIRSDRNITDNLAVGAGAEGGVNFELSYGAIDDLLEGALQEDWNTAVNISVGTISAAIGDQSFNDSGSGFVAAGIVAGQWIKVGGFTDPDNNGFFRVTSVVTGKLIVSGGATALNTESAPATVTIVGTHIHNSNTAKSYSLEVEYTDITKFLSYLGMRVADMNLDFSVGAIATGGFTFVGKSGAEAGTTISTGGPTAAPTKDVMNGVSNVLGLFEGESLVALTAKMSKLTLSLKNNPRGQNAIGTLGNVGVGTGRCDVSGTLSSYFEDTALYTKFIGNTATALAWRLQDTAGNAYIFSLPKVKLSDGSITAGGADSDVMADFSYQAVMHPTFLFTLSVDKFAA